MNGEAACVSIPKTVDSLMGLSNFSFDILSQTFNDCPTSLIQPLQSTDSLKSTLILKNLDVSYDCLTDDYIDDEIVPVRHEITDLKTSKHGLTRKSQIQIHSKRSFHRLKGLGPTPIKPKVNPDNDIGLVHNFHVPPHHIQSNLDHEFESGSENEMSTSLFPSSKNIHHSSQTGDISFDILSQTIYEHNAQMVACDEKMSAKILENLNISQDCLTENDLVVTVNSGNLNDNEEASEVIEGIKQRSTRSSSLRNNVEFETLQKSTCMSPDFSKHSTINKEVIKKMAHLKQCSRSGIIKTKQGSAQEVESKSERNFKSQLESKPKASHEKTNQVACNAKKSKNTLVKRETKLIRRTIKQKLPWEKTGKGKENMAIKKIKVSSNKNTLKQNRALKKLIVEHIKSAEKGNDYFAEQDVSKQQMDDEAAKVKALFEGSANGSMGLHINLMSSLFSKSPAGGASAPMTSGAVSFLNDTPAMLLSHSLRAVRDADLEMFRRNKALKRKKNIKKTIDPLKNKKKQCIERFVKLPDNVFEMKKSEDEESEHDDYFDDCEV